MPKNGTITLGVRADTSQLRRDVERGINQASKSIKPIDIRFDTQNASAPLGRIRAEIGEFNKSMDAASARVLAFGASLAIINGVTEAFKGLVRQTAETEKSLAEINVIFKTSTENLANFRDGLFSIAKETSTSFANVSKAAAEFSRQGLSMAETLQRTKDALILTRLAGLDVTESVNALTAAVNGFSDSAVTTTQILNKLVTVDSNFAVSTADLVESLARVGATAQDAGVSLEELLAITASTQQITARGGAVIGNAYKTIFTRLKRSSTIDQLKELGVAIDSTQSGVEKLKALAEAIDQISDPNKIAKINELSAGVFQINILSAILKDINREVGFFSQALDDANNATDEAVKRTAELNKTLISIFEQLTSQSVDLFSSIGDIALLENLKKSLKTVSDLFSGLNKFLDGEGVGVNFAKNIISGISNFITGPGAILFLQAFFTLAVQASKQFAQVFNELRGITTEAEKQKNLENAINFALRDGNKTLVERVALAENEYQRKRALLALLDDESKRLERNATIMRSLTQYAGLAGYSASGGVVQRPVKRAADGIMPAVLGESAAIKKGVGGARKSDKPVVVPNFNFGNKKDTIIANTGEKIVQNFMGGKGSAVINREMEKKMGDLSLFGDVLNLAKGYDPKMFVKNRNQFQINWMQEYAKKNGLSFQKEEDMFRMANEFRKIYGSDQALFPFASGFLPDFEEKMTQRIGLSRSEIKKRFYESYLKGQEYEDFYSIAGSYLPKSDRLTAAGIISALSPSVPDYKASQAAAPVFKYFKATGSTNVDDYLPIIFENLPGTESLDKDAKSKAGAFRKRFGLPKLESKYGYVGDLGLFGKVGEKSRAGNIRERDDTRRDLLRRVLTVGKVHPEEYAKTTQYAKSILGDLNAFPVDTNVLSSIGLDTTTLNINQYLAELAKEVVREKNIKTGAPGLQSGIFKSQTIYDKVYNLENVHKTFSKFAADGFLPEINPFELEDLIKRISDSNLSESRKVLGDFAAAKNRKVYAGSSRAFVRLNENVGLKVPFSSAGIAQSEKETSILTDNYLSRRHEDFLPKYLGGDTEGFRYSLVEALDSLPSKGFSSLFKQKTGTSFDVFGEFATYLHLAQSSDPRDQKRASNLRKLLPKSVFSNGFLLDFEEFIINSQLLPGDFARKANLGLSKDGKIKGLDFGFDKEINRLYYNGAEGFVPSFVSPMSPTVKALLQAIQREQESLVSLGFSKSKAAKSVKIGYDARLRSKDNPTGVGVYNTLQGQSSLRDAFQDHKGENLKTAGMVPNFAFESLKGIRFDKGAVFEGKKVGGRYAQGSFSALLSQLEQAYANNDKPQVKNLKEKIEASSSQLEPESKRVLNEALRRVVREKGLQLGSRPNVRKSPEDDFIITSMGGPASQKLPLVQRNQRDNFSFESRYSEYAQSLRNGSPALAPSVQRDIENNRLIKEARTQSEGKPRLETGFDKVMRAERARQAAAIKEAEDQFAKTFDEIFVKEFSSANPIQKTSKIEGAIKSFVGNITDSVSNVFQKNFTFEGRLRNKFDELEKNPAFLALPKESQEFYRKEARQSADRIIAEREQNKKINAERKARRAAKFQNVAIGTSFAASIANPFVNQAFSDSSGEQNVIGKVLGGATTGLSLGVFAGPKGAIAGALAGGLVGLADSIDQTDENARRLNSTFDKMRGINVETVGRISQYLQVQGSLNEAIQKGASPTAMQALQDQLNSLFSSIADPKIQSEIVKTGGNLEKLSEAFAKIQRESSNREKILSAAQLIASGAARQGGIFGIGKSQEALSTSEVGNVAGAIASNLSNLGKNERTKVAESLTGAKNASELSSILGATGLFNPEDLKALEQSFQGLSTQSLDLARITNLVKASLVDFQNQFQKVTELNKRYQESIVQIINRFKIGQSFSGAVRSIESNRSSNAINFNETVGKNTLALASPFVNQSQIQVAELGLERKSIFERRKLERDSFSADANSRILSLFEGVDRDKSGSSDTLKKLGEILTSGVDESNVFDLLIKNSQNITDLTKESKEEDRNIAQSLLELVTQATVQNDNFEQALRLNAEQVRILNEQRELQKSLEFLGGFSQILGGSSGNILSSVSSVTRKRRFGSVGPLSSLGAESEIALEAIRSRELVGEEFTSQIFGDNARQRVEDAIFGGIVRNLNAALGRSLNDDELASARKTAGIQSRQALQSPDEKTKQILESAVATPITSGLLGLTNKQNEQLEQLKVIASNTQNTAKNILLLQQLYNAGKVRDLQTQINVNRSALETSSSNFAKTKNFGANIRSQNFIEFANDIRGIRGESRFNEFGVVETPVSRQVRKAELRDFNSVRGTSLNKAGSVAIAADLAQQSLLENQDFTANFFENFINANDQILKEFQAAGLVSGSKINSKELVEIVEILEQITSIKPKSSQEASEQIAKASSEISRLSEELKFLENETQEISNKIKAQAKITESATTAGGGAGILNEMIISSLDRMEQFFPRKNPIRGQSNVGGFNLPTSSFTERFSNLVPEDIQNLQTKRSNRAIQEKQNNQLAAFRAAGIDPSLIDPSLISKLEAFLSRDNTTLQDPVGSTRAFNASIAAQAAESFANPLASRADRQITGYSILSQFNQQSENISRMESLGVDPKMIAEAREELEKLRKSLASIDSSFVRTNDVFGAAFTGIKSGFEQMRASSMSVAEQIAQTYQKIPQQLSDGFADAFVDAISGTKNLEDAVSGMLASVALDLARFHMRSAIMSAFGNIYGQPAGYNSGGYVQKRASGGSTRGMGLEPTMLTGGEFVASPEMVQAFGLDTFKGINSGTLINSNLLGKVRGSGSVTRSSGYVKGGNGVMDDQFRMLRPGSFVVNRQQSQRHAPILDAMSNGGPVQKKFIGGLVGSFLGGALQGAIVGGLTSLVTGQDIKKGLLFGALGGGLTGAIGSAVSGGLNTGTNGGLQETTGFGSQLSKGFSNQFNWMGSGNPFDGKTSTEFKMDAMGNQSDAFLFNNNQDVSKAYSSYKASNLQAKAMVGGVFGQNGKSGFNQFGQKQSFTQNITQGLLSGIALAGVGALLSPKAGATSRDANGATTIIDPSGDVEIETNRGRIKLKRGVDFNTDEELLAAANIHGANISSLKNPYSGMPYNLNNGGYVRKMFNGGYMSGPTSSTHDNIPAMVKAGEGVVNEKTMSELVQRFGFGGAQRFLQNGFEEGGIVSPSSLPMAPEEKEENRRSEKESGNSNFSVSITVNMNGGSEDSLTQVSSTGEKNSNASTKENDGKKLAKQIEGVVMQLLRKESRVNGMLHKKS